VDLVERVWKAAVGEDGLESSLDDHVRQTPVQPRMLEHVEDEQDALTSRLGTYQMLQLVCQSNHRSIHLNRFVFHGYHGYPAPTVSSTTGSTKEPLGINRQRYISGHQTNSTEGYTTFITRHTESLFSTVRHTDLTTIYTQRIDGM